VSEEVRNVRISILPKASLGRWSVGLAAAFILFFVLSQVILGPGPAYNMPLAYTLTIVVAGIGVAAFVTGLISIIKSKERSILVFLTTAIGFYSLFGAALLRLAK
jgi:hypothetical protein